MVPQHETQGNVPLPHSVAVTAGRARAVAHESIARALEELLAHDVATWEAHGLQRTKERSVRSVFRGALAGVPVHVKVFRAQTLADRARDALQRPRGEAEFDNLTLARERGLPAVEPLGRGVAHDTDQLRSFVITRTAVGAVSFSFEAPAPAHRAAGALLRTMHDAGFRPGDLHTDNLLVDASGQPILLDLTSLRHGGAPSLAGRAAALAVFCQALDGGPADPAARALLDAYVGAGPELPAAFDHELRIATHRWRAHALLAFGRRSERSCKHTLAEPRRRGIPRWFWHLDAAGEQPLRERCRALLDEPGEPLRAGRRGAVWLLPDLAIKQRDAAPARHVWRAAYWLQFARVPTAAPVALCLRAGRGFVFCRRLASPSLATEAIERRLPHEQAVAAATALGDAVGRLHAHGLRNRDLKLDNVVRDGAGRVCFVDLDGVRRSWADDTRGRGRDLGRLLASFRAVGSPGEHASVRAFLRGYARAHRRLLQRPPLRRILARAEQRAREWAAAHA